MAEAGYLEGERGAYRLSRPVEDSGVPVTVQAILTARIDRLDPNAKQLLQVASVVGKELGARALRLAAGLEEKEMEPALCALTESGFLYESEMYPERVFAFRHPLTREVAYGTQLGERRSATHAAAARATIELYPDRHDELAALIAHHMEEGGELLEAARWSARAAYWAGSSQPVEAMRLWRDVTRLAAQLEDGKEKTALSVTSRLLQLDFAWRIGMDPEEERRLAAEAEEIATRTGDLRALAMLRLVTGARPGLAQTVDSWIAAGSEATRLADESGELNLRVAIRSAASYPYLLAGDLEGFERVLDELIELAGGSNDTGAGIVIGNPVAWAIMSKGTVRKEHGDFEEAEALVEKALQAATETSDPETESWIRGTQALLRSAQGDLEGGVALARRNRELTERIGDVFSRSISNSNLATVELAAGDFEGALESIEEADRIYLDAMDNGGELEGWRGTIRAEALRGVGRLAEAIESAERACAICRERGLNWTRPLAALALGRARAAAGDLPGANEALEEAARVAEETNVTMTLAEIESERDSLTAGASQT
jgi:adenylate cyclase